MQFLKKRNKYKVMYNKEQAIKMLLKDKRIAKVKNYKYGLRVITNPMIPKSHNISYQYPIGSYTISLFDSFDNNIKIDIIRNEGTLFNNILAFHIRNSFTGKICWGTLGEEIGILKNNKDYFWIIKRCLDLIEDGDDNKISTTFTQIIMYELALNHLYNTGQDFLVLERLFEEKFKDDRHDNGTYFINDNWKTSILEKPMLIPKTTKPKFKIGDIVIGNEASLIHYTITKKDNGYGIVFYIHNYETMGICWCFTDGAYYGTRDVRMEHFDKFDKRLLPPARFKRNDRIVCNTLYGNFNRDNGYGIVIKSIMNVIDIKYYFKDREAIIFTNLNSLFFDLYDKQLEIQIKLNEVI